MNLHTTVSYYETSPARNASLDMRYIRTNRDAEAVIHDHGVAGWLSITLSMDWVKPAGDSGLPGMECRGQRTGWTQEHSINID